MTVGIVEYYAIVIEFEGKLCDRRERLAQRVVRLFRYVDAAVAWRRRCLLILEDDRHTLIARRNIYGASCRCDERLRPARWKYLGNSVRARCHI